MLLTGKYNFRNYSIWGLMNNGEKTIGNVMKDAGYSTGFFGKMQLYDQDSDMLNQGFEKYLVLENLTIPGALMRYKNPRLYQNGMQLLPDSVITGKYADDILTQAVFNFIDSNKAIGKPFFAYYPMSLAHSPYSPTPDDSAFATWNAANDVGDTTYFPSMIKYMDKKIGQIIAKLKADGLDNNTIIIFSGDNGTPSDITSVIDSANAEGGKASTTEAGTHVPLMIYWPGHITPAINNDLISYVDFMPTLADAAGVSNLSVYGGSDGVSFYQRLLGNTGNPRNWIFNHFDEYPGFYTDTLSRWVQNATYKLYDTTGSYYSGKFFNITTDVNQLNPLPDNTLTPDELAIKNQFLSVLDTMPKPPPFPVLDSNYAIATSGSVTVGATIISNGGSAIKERGSCAWYYPFDAYYEDKLIKDTITGMGTFQMYRTDNYVPQKRFVYSLYAMNNNKSNNTGWIKGSFMTLSKGPVKQPTSFTAKAAGCYVVLKWSSASWPGYGATKAGYLLIRSTGTPSLESNPNQHSLTKAVSNGTILPIATSSLPATPPLVDTIFGLSHDSTYHFLLVPYTWDGINDSTHNYLTTGGLTVSDTTLASQIVLSAIIKKPSCFGYSNGSITLSSTKGLLPYQYSINSGAYDTSSVRTVAAGTYAVTVKDFAGCTASKSVMVTQPTALGVTVTHTFDSCYGSNNAYMKLVGKGGTLPYLYSLNGSAYDTVSTFKGLTAATYTAFVEDKNICTFSQPVVITQAVALGLTITHTNDSCTGARNAFVKLAGKGGTKPYQYSFNGSAYDTVSTFTGLAAGTYNVSVKDKYLCTFSTSVAIAQSPKVCPASIASPANIGGSIANPGELKISVYPNPSASQFRLVINNGNPYQPIFIKVVDMYGKPVYRQYSAAAGTYTFGNGFATGVYLVQVQQGYRVKTLKIVKGN